MAEDIDCIVCNKTFRVAGKRVATAKYCSKKCEGDGRKKPPNSRCMECGCEFRRKPSELDRVKFGVFCNMDCFAEYKSRSVTGENNPNFKGRNVDSDGYKINVPHASGFLNSEKKLHRAVVADVLGVDRLPSSVQVHHRDCDYHNNTAQNLVMLTSSDHRWLHKQFGNATLWAYMNGKVDLETLISWSDDRERAKRLLFLDCTSQSVISSRNKWSAEDLLMANFEQVTDIEFVEVAR